jgi:hypothetical protein
VIATLSRMVALHLRARGLPLVVGGSAVAVAVALLGLHRSVFVPLSIASTVRLTPLLSLPFVFAGAPLIEVRYFSLDPSNMREGLVRVMCVATFASAASLALACVAEFHRADALVLGRNLGFFLGLALLLARWIEVRLALVVIGVAGFLYAYFGSDRGGEPRPWAWLLLDGRSSAAWCLALAALVIGVAVDVAGGNRGWEPR